MNLRRMAMAALVACGPGTAFAERGPEYWQELAQRDLDAARQLILEAHPGAIDESNPELRNWIDSGHRKATALVPEVFSYDSMLAAVRYYIAGFRDGHLVYSDNLRSSDTPMFTTGWRLEHRRGKVLVVAVATGWKTSLPAVGSELVSCDGSEPRELVRERVAPYVDRRGFSHRESLLVQSLDVLFLKRHRLEHCEFKGPDGAKLSVEVGYQPLATDSYWDSLVTPAVRRSPQRENGYTVKDGVLWVGAHDFSLSADQIPSLQTMLSELETLDGFDSIVFDTRGNRGGDSSVGESIFEAATGGLDFDRTDIDQLPRVHAQWRVSDVAIRSAREFVDRRREQYGDDSNEVAYARSHLKSLEDAKLAGEPWVEQPGGHRIDRAEVKRRGGRLARFDGPIVLLTDHGCASACLDFADTVLLAPGALHAGQETSGDSVYIDTARENLPSGNGFVIPLKVWRNRLRANNETLKPDVPIALDDADDDAVRRAVLEVLQRQGAAD